jgi:hypothetical protein
MSPTKWKTGLLGDEVFTIIEGKNSLWNKIWVSSLCKASYVTLDWCESLSVCYSNRTPVTNNILVGSMHIVFYSWCKPVAYNTLFILFLHVQLLWYFPIWYVSHLLPPSSPLILYFSLINNLSKFVLGLISSLRECSFECFLSGFLQIGSHLAVKITLVSRIHEAEGSKL